MRRTIAACCALILRSPGQWLSVRADTAHDVVAVAVPAAGFSGFDAAAEAPAGLVRKILEIERPHRPFQADVEFIDLALRDGDDPAAGKADALENMGDIFLVAGQPVEGLGDDDFEPAFQRILQ